MDTENSLKEYEKQDEINNSENIQENKIENREKPTIKHIVISGGGHYGFYSYGFLKESNKQGFWKIENIETMYGTSVGSMIIVALCLKYDWDILDNYLINRPWHKIFKIDIYSILNAFQTKGLFDISIFKDFFKPLFNGVDEDISIDVTMQEFYNITKKEIHIFVTEVNNFNLIDISYKTHPDYSLIEAVYESCSVPIIFSPLIKEDLCNIDGGLVSNYPLEYCLKNVENKEEILGVLKTIDFDNYFENNIKSDISFLDYLMIIFNKMLKKVVMHTFREHCNKIKHQCIIKTQPISIVNIIDILSSPEQRKEMMQKGADIFHNDFPYKNINSN